MQIPTDLLKKVYLFESLNADELSWLAGQATVKEVIAGDSIFNEGAKAEALFVVKQGTIEVRKMGAQEEQAVAMLSTGAVFGEMAFAHPSNRTASAVAKENCVFIEIAYETLRKKADETPAFGLKLYRSLAAYLSKRIQTTTHDLASLKELKLRSQ